MLNLSHQNIPVVIIGGGIHGISIAIRLIQDLEISQIPGTIAARHLAILDRYPQSLTEWLQKTRRQGMTFLRSPAVHHISTDPLGVVEYARSHGRTDELAAPYSQPSTDLFLDFCLHEINRGQIGQFYYHFDVAKLRWDKGGGKFPFRVISQGDEGFRARCVILAVGSDDCPYIPPEFAPWRRRFPEHILHSRDFDLQTFGGTRTKTAFSQKREKVVIIGGGLTAGTLAKHLVEQGWQVVLITRKPLKIQQFDFEPIWVGPKALDAFNNEPDWGKRYDVIQRVRGEGSVTPDIAEALKEYAATNGDFHLYTHAKILQIEQMERVNRLRIDTTQGWIDGVDLIILATGYRFNLRKYPFLSDLIEGHKVPILHGLPLLDENLQLLPVANLFGSGIVAQLQLGPASGNIVGATLAYDRLRKKVLKEIPLSLMRHTATGNR